MYDIKMIKETNIYQDNKSDYFRVMELSVILIFILISLLRSCITFIVKYYENNVAYFFKAALVGV